MKNILITLVLLFLCFNAFAQTSIGIGIYPTGTEPGIGFRSSKSSKWFAEGSVTKANFYSSPTLSSFLTELSAGLRVVKLEKVFFNIGLGIRNEWNTTKNNKIGVVFPVSVEAFPFPFQNAGLFFGVAGFYTSDLHGDIYAGIRTASGFMFYFPATNQKKPVTQ